MIRQVTFGFLISMMSSCSVCCLKYIGAGAERNWSAAGQKSGERERSGERVRKKLAEAGAERELEVAERGTERRSGVTEIGLSGERKFCRPRRNLRVSCGIMAVA